jgi:hypothetical protein
LLLKISEHNSFAKDNPVFGEYLVQIVPAAQYVSLADVEAKLMEGNKYFELKQPLEQGKTY